MSKSIALNIDCMEYMATVPDKYFDLAIVDPPYGIKMDGGAIGGGVLAKQAIYSKKTGIYYPQIKNIFLNLKGSAKTKLSGELIILYLATLLTVIVGLCGISSTEKIILPIANLLGLLFRQL